MSSDKRPGWLMRRLFGETETAPTSVPDTVLPEPALEPQPLPASPAEGALIEAESAAIAAHETPHIDVHDAEASETDLPPPEMVQPAAWLEPVPVLPMPPGHLAEIIGIEALETSPEAEVASETASPAPPPAVTAPVMPTVSVEAQPAAEPAARSWWTRLREGLSRTSSSIGTGVTDLFRKRKLDAATLEDLEDILIQADLGVDASARIANAVGEGRYDKEIAPEEVKAILAREVEAVLAPVARPLQVDASKRPFVILMVGVNGAGKTTTIGKLSKKFRDQGLSVMLAAGDTFRAAAIEQLQVWGTRVGAPVVTRPQGADAAGLAFDAYQEAKAKGTDVLLIDTAGRLQNKTGLMQELEKVRRVIGKVEPDAPHAVLLVLDATVGQNALSQVEIFGKVAGVTGLVMTKLDGTARGGILVALAEKTGLPVHFIGVGEGVEDLEPFAAKDFARAIAGLA